MLCGLDGLGFRTFEELGRLGEEVIVIVADLREGFGSRARAQGATIIEGNYRDEAILKAARIEQARAFVITESNDVGNIHAALAAQELNPTLRIVLRIFNQDFGGRLENLFHDCAVLSSSAIAAPSFVTAALRQTWEQEITLAGRTLRVRETSSGEADVLLPLARIRPNMPVELFPAGGDGLLCLTESGRETAAAEARKALKMRQPDALAYLRAVARNADSRLRYALYFLLALFLFSMIVFFIFKPDFADALYNTTSVIVSGGLGNVNPSEAPLPLKLFGIALMIIGATMLTVFYALITDAIVSVRLERALGRLEVHTSNHVVVCGLGNVGYRVVTQLHALGIPVAAAEKMEGGRGIQEVRRLDVPVLIADARSPDTLRALNIAEARCLVIATDDDAANLETALNARAIKPDLRVVLRLFDPDLAARVEHVFRIQISRSVSALAAPSFAAAAVGHKVAATIPAGNRVLIVAQETIAPNSWAEGRTILDLEHAFEGHILLLERPGQPQTWQPGDSTPLSAGDEIAIVATRKGLTEAIRITGTDGRR